MAKMPKVHTLFQDRTNASNRRFRELKTGTLEELCKYYGQTAKTIVSLVKKINEEYSRRYACCYRLSCSVSIATEEEKVQFATQVVD